MTEIVKYGITIESSHMETLHLTDLIKKYRKIHIFPNMKTAPLISLVVLCDDRCTITLDNQDMSVQNNVQELIKGTKNKQTVMWEVPLEIQQSEAVVNNIMSKTTKP